MTGGLGLIVGCQHESDARRFLDAMCERLRGFALSLHPEKTRLIEFGRFASKQRARRQAGKPETFQFLGFTFICGQSRRGRFLLKRKSRGDRMRTKLKEVKEEMRWRRLNRFQNRESGWAKSFAVSSRITQCRRIPVHSTRSITASWTYGDALSSGDANGTGLLGNG